MIVFSANISTKHREKLQEEFPEQHFVFCDSPEEAKKYTDKAEVYVTYGNDVDEKLINQAKQLKWVACISAGVDEFPLKKLEEEGIRLTNVRGIHKIQMAEYAITMLLQVYRNSKTLIENEKQAAWDKSVRVQEITGKRILILGTGAIGGETARLAKAFRMKTIGISRSGKNVENFDEVYQTSKLLDVLPEADLIVSVIPSTQETKHLFTYEQFAAMKPTAVFLNMGRGDLLKEDDLLRAIQEKEFAHAVLDVFEQEPLPVNHPFWQEENITVTPHISGLSPAYVERALKIFAENLKVYENGENDYRNVVNLKHGY
ncbi:D-2-hydroxyacid dehydrogenase [Oceanobacillus sp. FSL H7-0719]|uniref:D-2-hydroxyacid dehydrogenase n=1 Tax=Oceanobacillus sp. FSL H7-0719 TaxID=2954507 RepID=UPI003249C687